MDLEEWELLPKNNDKSLDFDIGQDDDHEATKMIKSFDMDFPVCSTQESVGKTELHQRSSVVSTQLLQIPTNWEPVSTVEDIDHKDKKNTYPIFSDPHTEETKTKENEFADMIIDSPAMFTSPLPQNDKKYSDSERGFGEEYYDEITGSDVEESSDLRSKKDVDWDGEERISGERTNLWKMGLNGIGTICSFGVAAAAATICVFALGHNNIQGSRNKNQILRFQIYSDDNKRMNEVVKHTTKLNEAISMMKSLPVARAHISFGGYYDGI